MSKINTFNKLNKVNIKEYIEHKGQFMYLSWAHAVEEVCSVEPETTWEVHEYEQGNGLLAPYMKTDTGFYVKVTVWVNGIDRSQTHPVLDHKNQPIAKPNSFQINTSIQRCLAKAIALHGLGLSLFYGEDLPKDAKEEEKKALMLTDKEKTELINTAKKVGREEQVQKLIKSGEINKSNFDKSLDKLRSEDAKKA